MPHKTFYNKNGYGVSGFEPSAEVALEATWIFIRWFDCRFGADLRKYRSSIKWT